MRLLITLFALMATGCATTTASQRMPAYTSAPVCCDDASEFEFASLPERGTVSATLDHSSKLFDFHSGISPFAAYELPRTNSPYRVRVKSLFEGKLPGQVFYPVVAILDDTFIVVRLAGLDTLRLDQGLTTLGGEPGLVLTLPIIPASERERYLVVFTPAVLLRGLPEERREGDMLTPAAMGWLARNQQALIPPSPYGRLQLSVAPELPNSANP